MGSARETARSMVMISFAQPHPYFLSESEQCPPLPPAPAGLGDLDQPDHLDLRLDAWAALSRGTFDGTPEVVRFAENLEEVYIDTVESGDMMRDLAILIRADHPWLTTNRFLDKLDGNLQKTMAS